MIHSYMQGFFLHGIESLARSRNGKIWGLLAENGCLGPSLVDPVIHAIGRLDFGPSLKV